MLRYTGQSKGLFLAKSITIFSTTKEVLLKAFQYLGQHFLGTIQFSHSILYLDIHLDTD